MQSTFPYRLKSARIQRGLTQEELGRAIGVSKQAISQYEHGRKKPNSRTLVALARYLNKPAAYFLRPVIAPLDQVEFRKKAKLKGKKLAIVKANILDRLEPYLELEDILQLDIPFQNPLADFPVQSVEDAERAADHLRQAWNIGSNPIPNSLEMLEDVGVKVVEVDADLLFDGLSTWIRQNIPVIVLNQQMDVLRKRFTTMHELGHLLLQLPNDADHSFKENVCNRFAGAMLIPAAELIKELGEKRNHLILSELVAVKEYFGISLAALVYRCRDLEIFSNALSKRFWKWRSQNPDLKKENGFGTYAGVEHSNRFAQLLYKALAEDIISLSKAAGLSQQSIQELQQKHELI